MANAWMALGLAVALTIADWIAILRGRRSWEVVLAPAVMAALALLIVLLPASGIDRTWHLGAVLVSLVGDILLLRPDPDGRMFYMAIGTFLVAHIAYAWGMASFDLTWQGAVLGVAIGATLLAIFGVRIVMCAWRESRPLTLAVMAYIAAIAAMLTIACATGLVTAMAGAVLFCLADVVFGWGRFVGPLPRERLLTMTLYHPAQFGLVLGLVEAAR